MLDRERIRAEGAWYVVSICKSRNHRVIQRFLYLKGEVFFAADNLREDVQQCKQKHGAAFTVIHVDEFLIEHELAPQFASKSQVSLSIRFRIDDSLGGDLALAMV
jgi:hypothetical protein